MFETLDNVSVRAATREGRIIGRRPSIWQWETFERFEDVASISCVANLAYSGARCPAPIGAKARVCSDNDSADKCFDLEGPRSSQHGGVRRHFGRAHTLLYSQNAESVASEYFLSYLLTTLVWHSHLNT